jgi:mercuric ion transport protein
MSDDGDATSSPARPTGAALSTLGGLAAAFGAASCCGLPLLLASLGLGSAWLGGLAAFAAPNRVMLLTLGAIGLTVGGLLLWRASRASACAPDSLCAKPAFRGGMIAGLLSGAGLLYLGVAYA